ncbi:MAG: plastocyanin/azurin family copper-binding protein [Casimicrobiaceae bacterium]
MKDASLDFPAYLASYGPQSIARVCEQRRLASLTGFCALLLLTMMMWAVSATAHTFEVRAVMSKDGADVYFDPVGLRIQPGDTVRWVQVNGYHSIASYHPENGNHELRIPDGAQPWDSGILLAEYPAKGSVFEHTFTVPGVYDYFCDPHEAAGMVGRIVVGAPGNGPGTRAFGYAPDKHWKLVPVVAQKALPTIQLIEEKAVVRAGQATHAK